jgi:hypothetical protein
MFKHHIIIDTFLIELGGITISIEVKVVDTLLDYNVFLGYSWFFMMKVVVSSVFRVLCCPHEGKVIIIDQFSYCTLDSRNIFYMNVLCVSSSMSVYDSIGVFMFNDSSLMGTFTLPPPFNSSHTFFICMICLGAIES